MVLGVDELLKRVKKEKLVEGLSDRELNNPEGAGFDLRLGEVFTNQGKSFLGIDTRKTPELVLVAKYDEKKNNKITIKPGDFYLTRTIESVNLPGNLTAILYTRGTLIRSGIIHERSQTAPGYKGKLITALYNAGQCEVEIEMGCRYLHIQFYKLTGKGSKYRGQWVGGRLAAKKMEKQV